MPSATQPSDAGSAVQRGPDRHVTWSTQVQMAAVLVVVDELERALNTKDRSLPSCLCERLADELELLASVLRRRSLHETTPPQLVDRARELATVLAVDQRRR